MKANLPPELRKLVVSEEEELMPADVDQIDRLHTIASRSTKITAILAAWKEQQNQERVLRKRYASWLLIAVFFQIITINTLFVLIGLKVIEVEQWLAAGFITGVFAEIAGMTLIIVNYLFPKTPADMLVHLERL